MSRSTKKGPSVHEGLLKKIEEMDTGGGRKIVKTWSRSPTAFPQMIDHTITVHDRREHIPVFVSEGMIGHRLGRLTLIRTCGGHDCDEKAIRKGK